MKGEQKLEKNRKIKRSTTGVLILSPPGKRKQSDKEQRDNKEKMDCYIFKQPKATEKRREKREMKTAYFLFGLQASKLQSEAQ